MNKGIKRIVSIVLAISAFTILEPIKYSNIMITKAYADSDIYLRGIGVTDGDDIILNSATKTYTTNVPNIDTEAVIRVSTNKKTDKVTIDDDSNPQKQSDTKFTETVTLEKGVNTFKIVVEDEDGKNEREYTLKIDRGGKQSTDINSVFLDNINIDFGDLEFLKTTTSYDVNVAENISQLRVQGTPENDNYIVRIDGTEVDDSDKFRRMVDLSKGENTISIDVEDNQDDTNTKTYTLNVYRGKDPSKTNDTTATNVNFDTAQDPIYLDDIVLDDGDVKFTPHFNKKITSYAADVSESSEDVIVKAQPEYAGDIVKINGTTTKSDDKNRERVSLTEGKNVIQIQVNTDCDLDDKNYEKRIYTLTVYRGTSEGSSATATTNSAQGAAVVATNTNDAQNTTSSNTNSSTGKPNQWININGKWQYNDSTGNTIKNNWYSDKNYGKTYYLQADGTMATGWLYNNGSWYYLDLSGAMQIGWKQIGPAWYYLYSSGVMATNTTIEGYKLGVDGAWTR